MGAKGVVNNRLFARKLPWWTARQYYQIARFRDMHQNNLLRLISYSIFWKFRSSYAARRVCRHPQTVEQHGQFSLLVEHVLRRLGFYPPISHDPQQEIKVLQNGVPATLTRSDWADWSGIDQPGAPIVWNLWMHSTRHLAKEARYDTSYAWNFFWGSRWSLPSIF